MSDRIGDQYEGQYRLSAVEGPVVSILECRPRGILHFSTPLYELYARWAFVSHCTGCHRLGHRPAVGRLRALLSMLCLWRRALSVIAIT